MAYMIDGLTEEVRNLYCDLDTQVAAKLSLEKRVQELE
ncbi:TMH-family membrane domain protein [Chlamydia psittaci WS/RT/E30]|nr:TMH-family membrane domain protein [Chlamydia psittaci WS/RT/E30]